MGKDQGEDSDVVGILVSVQEISEEMLPEKAMDWDAALRAPMYAEGISFGGERSKWSDKE